MLTKSQLLASIGEEIRIVRHLARKIPPGTHDWRPTPGQRSTIELLRYLSTAAIDLATEVMTGGWDVTHVTGKAPKDLPAADFDAAMARQDAAIRRLLDPLSEADFAQRPATLPTGEASRLGVVLVNVVLKALVAYRMQLFLYAKHSGNAALSTYDCWFGVDGP